MNNQSNIAGRTVAGILHKLKMIQAITTNLENTNTAGYQRQIPESLTFGDALSEAAMKDKTQGMLNKTNNTFDLAIEGNAYFLVESKNGPTPTRNGKFHLNEKGLLVTTEGNEVVVVDKSNKELSLSKTTNIKIDQTGEIYVDDERYGRIAMKLMDNKPVTVRQGFIEGSNVNIMNEMVALQMVFRNFEASEKLLGMEASVDKDLIEKYGRNV